VGLHGSGNAQEIEEADISIGSVESPFIGGTSVKRVKELKQEAWRMTPWPLASAIKAPAVWGRGLCRT
jgi:hypothetical protein